MLALLPAWTLCGPSWWGAPGGGGGGGIDWDRDTPNRLYKAPTDYTKPRNIRQSPRNIIQSPEY